VRGFQNCIASSAIHRFEPGFLKVLWIMETWILRLKTPITKICDNCLMALVTKDEWLVNIKTRQMSNFSNILTKKWAFKALWSGKNPSQTWKEFQEPCLRNCVMIVLEFKGIGCMTFYCPNGLFIRSHIGVQIFCIVLEAATIMVINTPTNQNRAHITGKVFAKFTRVSS